MLGRVLLLKARDSSRTREVLVVSRLSAGGLVALAESLSERDRQLVQTVGRLRMVSGKQLERLFFSGSGTPATGARLARRALARLVALRILARLERRVGGVRAGSAGWVYALDLAGQRLLRYWRGEGLERPRVVHEPGTPFVRHTLAVTELYARLREAEQAGTTELLWFETEPECWRRFSGPLGAVHVLKPDAFVVLGMGEYEERSFVEVDCGTEGRGALVRKCRLYLDYWRSGLEEEQHGVFPRVAWITTTERRVSLLTEVCGSLPPEAWRLFVIGRPELALELLASGTDASAEKTEAAAGAGS